MFQFLVDWKRKSHGTHRTVSESSTDFPQTDITRMPSINSTVSSPSSYSIDWQSDKRTWSFKDDYVSFPSLEPEPPY
ncbi:hypothetical protein F4703DRAFT_1943408 [Phycomyces blakesleeanus]